MGIPEIPESVFRGAVQRDGEPLSDILQEWLISQVIRCAARRKPLEIRKRVFSRLFKREWA